MFPVPAVHLMPWPRDGKGSSGALTLAWGTIDTEALEYECLKEVP